VAHPTNTRARPGFAITGAPGRGAPDAPAAAAPGVHGDRLRAVSRASREQPSDLRSKLALELHILAGPALLFSLAPARAEVLVGQALGFCLLERGVLDEHSLALVALARTAEANDDCREAAVLARTSRDRRIAGPEEH